MDGRPVPAGWYPDPLGRADWRYWDGEAWNARVADRQQHTWVDEEFVAEERARAAAVTPPAAVEEPVLEVAAEAQEPLPESPAPTPRVPRVRQHRVRHAIAAMRGRIAADLAAHWLAYVGVVLIFVGVFGFMVFSFRDVGRNWRPVAEVMIPAALAGAAWYLRRQGAPFVASLVAGLAGALLPIAVITSFNDDFGFPPDIAGAARPLVSGAICVLIGVAYAWWTTRRPASSLRFLAAPAAWLGVGVAVGAFADPIPLGTHVARADAWQSAAMMIAIAVTLLVARVRPRHPLAEGTVGAAFPGIAITTAFVLAAIIPDGPWFGAATAAALAALVAFDLLEPRLRPTATAILDAVALAAAVLTLDPWHQVGWQFAAGALGLLALAEWVGRRRTPAWLLTTFVVLSVPALVGTLVEPWAMVVAFGAAALWANARRLLVPRWLTNADLMTALAAALPVGFAWGLLLAASEGVALLTIAGVLVAVAAFVRIDRDTDDPYWRAWIPAAFVGAEVATVVATDVALPMYGWLAGAAGLLTVVALVMPAPAAWRRWIAAAAAVWTAWLTVMAVDLGDTGPAVRTFALGVVTVLVVLVARRAREQWQAPLALVGAALGLATLASGGDWGGWDRAEWATGVAAYGGVAALGVTATTFVRRAKRALVWPWALVAGSTVGGAAIAVVERPHVIGEGVAGITTAIAAAVVATCSFRLAHAWKQTAFVEGGVAYAFAAGTSLAIGLAATGAAITVGALAVGLAATIVSVLVGPRPAPAAPRAVSPWQRGAFEAAGLAATAAIFFAPSTGHLGWLAATAWGALVVESLAVAIRWRAPNLTTVSAIASAVAFVELGVWGGWANTTWLMAAAISAAAGVVGATSVAVVTRVARAWLMPWLAVGLAASATVSVAAFLGADGATRGTPGYVAAGATLAVACVGILADRWRQPAWRWVSGTWMALAAAIAAVAGDLSTTEVARGAAITAIAVTVLVVATWRVRALETWHRAGTALAALALVASVPGTLIEIDRAAQWSDVASLVTLVLFAFATEAWTFGTLWRRPVLSESAPFWLVGAWCAFAAGSLSGNAQWYTVPIGVALIGVEEIRRADHRRAGLPPYSVSGRWIEYLGMMLIVGTSMFQTVTVSTSYALVGIVLGMAIATWGALTHVRRRAVFGTASTLLAVVLMLAVPLARVLPNTPTMVVWISVAAIGVIAVTSAAFIERGRHAWRNGVRRFGSATHDWE